METMLLREKDILPTEEVIENALGESYLVYKEFIETVTGKKTDLVTEWRFYNDGKAWLCKVVNKKKTVFWLSVWDKFFKIAFYFTEKTSLGITELDIDNTIIENFSHSKHIGKLIPLVINMQRKEQLDDAIKIIEYKKELK